MPYERTSAKGTGEFGKAGRIFDNAININNPRSLQNDYHNSHNRVYDWIYKLPSYEKNN